MIGLTGKEYDPDVKLNYFNARWYDPDLGRFISEDPAADPANPNLYSYCANNPLNRIDPTGQYFNWVVVLFAAILGGAQSADAGGSFLDGFVRAGVMAAITAGFGEVIQGLSCFANFSQVATLAVSGGIMSAFQTALNGGSLFQILQSGFFGGIRSALFNYVTGPVSNYFANTMAQKWFSDAIISGINGGLNSIVYGGNFVAGFVGGVKGYVESGAWVKGGARQGAISGGSSGGDKTKAEIDDSNVVYPDSIDPFLLAAGAGAPKTSTEYYDGEAAAAYALKYADKTNSKYGRQYYLGVENDCTNFVSQCLYEGGLPQDSTWFFDYPSKTGTPAWVGAPQLNKYLQSSGWLRAPIATFKNNEIGKSNNATQDIKKGDIIQIMNSAGQIHHTMIVTGINPTRVSYHTNDQPNVSLRWVMRNSPGETFLVLKMKDKK